MGILYEITIAAILCILAIMNQMLRTNSRNIFLFDGLGALLSAILLGLVLANMEVYFGMPPQVLYVLAGLACLLALYSISCAVLLSATVKPYLLFIAMANFTYCCLTAGLVFYYYNSLTALGIAYFLIEMIVIISLVIMELAVYRQLSAK